MTQISKDNRIVNAPIYAIHGEERKLFIKKRNQLRSFIRSSWHMVSVNNDMYGFYGNPENIITHQEHQKHIDKVQVELDEIESKLAELYKNDK